MMMMTTKTGCRYLPVHHLENNNNSEVWNLINISPVSIGWLTEVWAGTVRLQLNTAADVEN